jgi:hypothetical protein
MLPYDYNLAKRREYDTAVRLQSITPTLNLTKFKIKHISQNFKDVIQVDTLYLHRNHRCFFLTNHIFRILPWNSVLLLTDADVGTGLPSGASSCFAGHMI